MSERARRSALVGVLLAAAAFFAVWVSRFYPIHRWLFWRYLGYWFGAGVWATA